MKGKTLAEQLVFVTTITDTLNAAGLPYRVSVSIDGLRRRGENAYNDDPDKAVEDGDIRVRLQQNFNWIQPEAAPKTVTNPSQDP